ncbi:MAG: zf-HC2 domain-containing protein [Pirellulales bacterium]|nr:zf-HC2 domain-containing protein [Pirellulales bacterium]
MKCEELLAALNDYIDGDRASVLCQALEGHLAECNPCQIVIDNVRQTIALYKAGQPFDLPPELHEQLHQLFKERWEKKFAEQSG